MKNGGAGAAQVASPSFSLMLSLHAEALDAKYSQPWRVEYGAVLLLVMRAVLKPECQV